MRLLYCPSCRRVSMKSRFEKDTCEECGKAARAMPLSYPWQYLAGAAIVIAGAVFLVLPQVADGYPWSPLVETLPQRLVWLVAFVGAGFFFSNWGVRVMKASALRRGAEMYPEAEA